MVTDGEILEDGLPSHVLGHSATPHVGRPSLLRGRIIYIQPSDLKDDAVNKKNIDAAVRSCMSHGHVLQLQIHKLIGAE